MLIFPTRDVHLLAAAGLTDTIHLSLMDDVVPAAGPPAVWTDLAQQANVMIAAATPGAAFATAQGRSNPPQPNDSPTGVSFTPTANAGTNTFLVNIFVGGTGDTVPVRVTVHPDINRIFLAQPTITMIAGENNVVLTVFGEFADAAGPTWADISEHPYLDFVSTNNAVAAVGPDGRVHAVTPGNAVIQCQVRGRAATMQACTVHVVTLADLRTRPGGIQIDVLQAPRKATKTCYVLTEGFSDGNVALDQAHQVVDKWMRDEANSPFRWLRDHFRVVAISDPVADRGIAVGTLLATLPPNNINIQPQTPANIAGLPQQGEFSPARDTRFGLLWGARLGDPQTLRLTAAQMPQAAEAWLRPDNGQPVRADRAIIADHRKLSPYRDVTQNPVAIFDPRAAFKDFLQRYLTAMGFALLPDDRVVILVDDQFRGGARLAIAGVEPVENHVIAMTTGSDTQGFDNWQLVPGSPILTRSPLRRTFHAGWVASSVVHEIGHTFGLGDEYENQRTEFLPQNPTAPQLDGGRLALEGYDNLVLRQDVFNGAAIDPSRIKWSANRVRKGSHVLSVAQQGAFIVANVTDDPRRVWKLNETARLRTLYARPRPSPPQAQDPRLLEFAVTIASVNPTTVLLTSNVNVPLAEFAAGGLLYAPRTQRNGADLTLIDPGVVAHLTATNVVFPKPSGCGAIAQGANEEEVRPPGIAGVTMPSRPADLIGLYEGGNDFSCGVLRPAGRCKLRRAAVFDEPAQRVREVWPFCFVCRYVIVDRVDPAQHARLDGEYPKDC